MGMLESLGGDPMKASQYPDEFGDPASARTTSPLYSEDCRNSAY